MSHRIEANALSLARSAWRRAMQAADAAELQRHQLRELVDRDPRPAEARRLDFIGLAFVSGRKEQLVSLWGP